MKTAPALAFDYTPSRVVAGALLGVTALAALAPWFSALRTLLRVIASVAIVAGAVLALRRFSERRFRRIGYGAAGWTLTGADAVEHAAILQAQAQLGLYIALVFRLDRRRRFVALLLPDNCARDMRRRLLLSMRAGAAATAH